MSIQTVADAASAVAELAQGLEDGQRKLKTEMAAAKAAGVPVAAIARAAGVSRQTAIKWLDEA